MDNWQVILRIETQRRDEQIAEAKHMALVKEALLAHPVLSRFYQRGLILLGTALVAWGCRLQSRYETQPMVPEAANYPPESSFRPCSG